MRNWSDRCVGLFFLGQPHFREEDEVRRLEEVMTAILTANLVDSTTSGVLAGEVEEMGEVERSWCGVLVGEPFQHAKQSWGWSKVENDEMMMQLENFQYG